MPRSAPVDGFTLAYDRAGAGDPVVLLHGWPGDRTDFEALVPRSSPAPSASTTWPRSTGRRGP